MKGVEDMTSPVGPGRASDGRSLVLAAPKGVVADLSAPTLAEACIEPSLKMAEASTQLAEVSAALASTDGKDPAAMVEAIKGMGEYFGTISESVSDTQLKASLAGMAQGYAGLATGYSKMFIDNDLTASAEVMQAISGLQTSITDFQTLCGVS